jgi:hypothetical protein
MGQMLKSLVKRGIPMLLLLALCAGLLAGCGALKPSSPVLTPTDAEAAEAYLRILQNEGSPVTSPSRMRDDFDLEGVAAVSVKDINRDGVPELIYSRIRDGRLYVFVYGFDGLECVELVSMEREYFQDYQNFTVHSLYGGGLTVHISHFMRDMGVLRNEFFIYRDLALSPLERIFEAWPVEWYANQHRDESAFFIDGKEVAQEQYNNEYNLMFSDAEYFLTATWSRIDDNSVSMLYAEAIVYLTAMLSADAIPTVPPVLADKDIVTIGTYDFSKQNNTWRRTEEEKNYRQPLNLYRELGLKDTDNISEFFAKPENQHSIWTEEMLNALVSDCEAAGYRDVRVMLASASEIPAIAHEGINTYGPNAGQPKYAGYYEGVGGDETCYALEAWLPDGIRVVVFFNVKASRTVEGNPADTGMLALRDVGSVVIIYIPCELQPMLYARMDQFGRGYIESKSTSVTGIARNIVYSVPYSVEMASELR